MLFGFEDTLESIFQKAVLRRKRGKDGVDGGEDPPVPIPNTEVKLTSVDNTWLATAREDRATPSQMKSKAQLIPVLRFYFYREPVGGNLGL